MRSFPSRPLIIFSDEDRLYFSLDVQQAIVNKQQTGNKQHIILTLDSNI